MTKTKKRLTPIQRYKATRLAEFKQGRFFRSEAELQEFESYFKLPEDPRTGFWEWTGPGNWKSTATPQKIAFHFYRKVPWNDKKVFRPLDKNMNPNFLYQGTENRRAPGITPKPDCGRTRLQARERAKKLGEPVPEWAKLRRLKDDNPTPEVAARRKRDREAKKRKYNRKKAEKLGLPEHAKNPKPARDKQALVDRVVELMLDGETRTTPQIVDALGINFFNSRETSIRRTRQYLLDHPTLFEWVDKGTWRLDPRLRNSVD